MIKFTYEKCAFEIISYVITYFTEFNDILLHYISKRFIVNIVIFVIKINEFEINWISLLTCSIVNKTFRNNTYFINFAS